MWISDDGRAISNAWADPSAVLPSSVLTLIDALPATELAELDDALDEGFLASVNEVEDFAAKTTPAEEVAFQEK